MLSVSNLCYVFNGSPSQNTINVITYTLINVKTPRCYPYRQQKHFKTFTHPFICLPSKNGPSEIGIRCCFPHGAFPGAISCWGQGLPGQCRVPRGAGGGEGRGVRGRCLATGPRRPLCRYSINLPVREHIFLCLA